MNDIVEKIAAQCSTIGGKVNELDLVHLRPYLEGFLDPAWLRRNLDEYEAWAVDNSDPVLQSKLLHRPLGMNMLVAAIWAARYWEDEWVRNSAFRPPAGAKRLLNIASNLGVLQLNADSLLDPPAIEHIQQRMQAAGALWGIIHELNTYSVFVRIGTTADPKFLNKASAEEILVYWREVLIPVQCKAKKPGGGRIISKDSFTTLAGSIAKDAKSKNKKILARIGSTGEIRPHDIAFLRKEVDRGAGSKVGPDIVRNDGRTFTIKTEPLSDKITESELENYLSSFNFHTGMVIGDPTPNASSYTVDAVVGIDGRPHENRRTWRSLHNSITDAARQLEGGPPGIIAIHYADAVDDFESLRPGSRPMRAVIGEMLDSLPHVGAVVLSSEPDLQIPGTNSSAPASIFYGRKWPFPTDFPLA